VSSRKDADIINNNMQLLATFLYISFALLADLPSCQGWRNPELFCPVLTKKFPGLFTANFVCILSRWSMRKNFSPSPVLE
jgi:hypothetical protein